MKNLYKKISAIVLVGALAIGGCLANGLKVHANSNKVIDNIKLVNKYKEIINKIPDSESMKVYDKLSKRIEEEANQLEGVKFSFAALPGDNVEKLFREEIKKFGFKDLGYVDDLLYGGSDLVDYFYKFKKYHGKPYLAQIDGFDGKYYKFIVYIR